VTSARITRDLANFTRGVSILEARWVERDISSDIVICWSTKTTPYEFLSGCPMFVHAPGFLEHVEVVADQEILVFRDIKDLGPPLEGRRLVRFNVADWSVIWMGPAGHRPAQIQAVVGRLPSAMSDMVKQSINGFSGKIVDAFFEKLRTTAAAI
jgi:hypothetical protein